MNPKLFIVAVVCLELLATLTFAQTNMDTARRQMHENIANRSLLSDLLMGHKANVDGLVPYLGMSYMREGLGFSQEQLQKVQQAVLRNMYPVLENNPDFISLREEMQKFDPNSSDATEETLKKFADLRVAMDEMIKIKQMSLLYENLTSEQKKKIYEFHISSMSETEFIFPSMFEALDLSDGQKTQFDKIQKGIMPELEKHVGMIRELGSKEWRMIEERSKTSLPNPQVREIQVGDGARSDVIMKIRAELQPERDKLMESGKKLADELKIQMFDVLTDAQWKRMIDLVDNPPEYVKKLLAETRKSKEKEANKPGEWIPGPNSWKPGDAIPEEYRQQRNERQGRFPRGE
jgi:Ni/Co efflux regulator RcnB